MNGRQKAVRKRSPDGGAQNEEPAFGRAASTAPTPSGNILRSLSVAIVGLGLMGGSLALALHQRRAVKKIIGISRQRATLEAALTRRAVDEASDQLEAAREADIIILATPARTILRQLPRVGDLAPDGALVLDLGSTKREIVQAMGQLPPRLFAVGGHPMCGKEASGFAVAEPSLYEDKLFVLTPSARSTDASLALAAELAQAVGARVLMLDAERHDQLVAAISHLPFVVAANLMQTIEEWAAGDDQVWELASSGFRDTTRLAASDVDMMLDILLTNSENIAGLMRRYSRQFGKLADLIYDQEDGELREILERAARRRRNWQGDRE